MKKSLIFLLIAAMLLPCLLGGCNLFGNPTETTPEATTPEETTPAGDTSDTPEVPTMKLTTVNVTTGEDITENYAGAELLAYLNKKGITASPEGYPISISIDPTLGMDSFKIVAAFEENAGMTITGGNGRGVLYGVYKFLEKYAGFRYFTPSLEVCYDGDVIIPEGIVLEHTPTLLSRRHSWYGTSSSPDWMVKNAVNSSTALSGEFGGYYLNYGSLGVHTIGTLSETTYPYPVYATNPCLTDPEVLATVIKNVRKELEKNPDITIASVSQSDYEQSCYCPNCAKIAEEEGSYSGVWIRFVNAVAEALEADYPDLLIDTLAYKNTQTPPKITKPNKNVVVRLCSIKCCFTHPLSDPDCPQGKKLYEDIIGWGKICENVHVWDYTTNFYYYISTYANLFALRENMRFYADNNVVSMFPQGNSQGASGEFGELRAYLLAQLMWDPYMSEEEYSRHMNEFLEAYYGAGWTFVREYIDLTSKLALNGGYMLDGEEKPTDAVCGQGIYDHPFTVITREEYYDFSYRFDECWALAEAMAEGQQKEHVQRSALQWRLAKLYLQPDAAEAQKLINDAKAWGVVWKEGQPNVQSSSDLSLSPYYWKYGS